jgi:cob(I)alamin adenosyltransferase
MNESLPMLKEFILPSGSLACSYAHQARAVCRRAERALCQYTIVIKIFKLLHYNS